MDQKESKLHKTIPIKPRKAVLGINIIFPYVFTLTAWRMAKTTAHQNSGRGSYLDPGYIFFVKIVKFYLVTQSI